MISHFVKLFSSKREVRFFPSRYHLTFFFFWLKLGLVISFVSFVLGKFSEPIMPTLHLVLIFLYAKLKHNIFRKRQQNLFYQGPFVTISLLKWLFLFPSLFPSMIHEIIQPKALKNVCELSFSLPKVSKFFLPKLSKGSIQSNTQLHLLFGRIGLSSGIVVFKKSGRPWILKSATNDSFSRFQTFILPHYFMGLIK